MYNASIVANALLQRGFKESRRDLTPMKVQKLVWFLNGWHLAITGAPSITQPFEAWQYGPVVSSIYHGLKKYGSSPVTDYLKDYDPTTSTFIAYVPAVEDTKFAEILDLTWEKYIGIDAIGLSAMTHAPGSPWYVAKQHGQSNIDNTLIKNYFIGLATSAQAVSA